MGRSDVDGADASIEASESLGVPTLTAENSQTQTSASTKPASSGNVSGSIANANMRSLVNNDHGSSAGVSHSTTPVPDEPAQSVPMTASSSNSSNQSAKEAQALAITHYGTRSRNKPASARPNYAEDVEMDFEQPSKAAPTRDSLSKSPPASSSRPSPAAAQSKRGAQANGGWASSGNQNSSATASSSPIPGTSTFSANPSTHVPKKRKAATANPATTLTQGAAGSASSSSRRATQTAMAREAGLSNMFSFEKNQAKLKNGKLIADDGTVFSVNDHVYLVCEPPGDPYYMGRVMEFRTKESSNANSPVNALRINWVYRPRDVLRFASDTRLVYVTMHSDVCPLTSLRGKCTIKHRSEIDDLDIFRKQPNHFYFSQAHDRFIHRWYEVIPTSEVVNVPKNVKRALDERWKYIIVEATKVKELTSAVKSCKRCADYCGSDNSVECAVCKNTYHMNCVRPPLLKKPSRGFAWACGPCSRAQERKLEARRTPMVGTNTNTPDIEEEDMVEEEEEDLTPQTTAPTPEAMEDRPATEAEIAHAKLWTMRYLGIHCRVEDALQYDDRAIYPRASSRIGPKHQANTEDWPGQAITLVPRTVIEKKYVKAAGHKKDTKLSKETLQAIDEDRKKKAKRPKWVQDEPEGYVARGEDYHNSDAKNTARTIFRMPEVGELSERGLDDSPTAPEEVVTAYMERVKTVAHQLGIHPYSVDFLDRALFLFSEHKFDDDAAIKELSKTDVVGQWPKNPDVPRTGLRDPRFTLNADEKKKFEQAVTKYGSELGSVTRHIGSNRLKHGDIVRYWYYWKKTTKGKEIWGSYGGRKHTKKQRAETEAASRLLDDIADDMDDSAYDNEKIEGNARKMVCKHCARRSSRIWRRAPGVAPGQVQVDSKTSAKKENLVIALCERCARLWRNYAIKWENQDELGKKVAAGGGRAWKKKVDEELLKEWELLTKEPQPTESIETVETPNGASSAGEPAKKKAKIEQAPQEVKKKPGPPPAPPRLPTPPPAMPKMKDWPCAICDSENQENDQLLVCRDCRLTVHKKCYGQPELRTGKWSCDMCANDRKESASVNVSALDPASYEYNCVLCPVHITQRDLVEPHKISHKKKNDKDREREKKEKDLINILAEQYRQQQRDRGRPQLPREPLKRTADNNWVHVTCALFIPEVKFSNSRLLDSAEGVPFALRYRKDVECSICKTNNGAAIECNIGTCHKSFHVTCAIQDGYLFGLDVNPVKSSRRDSVNIVTIGGDTGAVNAVIWCKEHSPAVKGPVHQLNEKVDENGTSALQLYAQNFKQADLTLTGTTRKANQLDEYTRLATGTDGSLNRRVSIGNIVKAKRDVNGEHSSVEPLSARERSCFNCKVEVSPRWWKVEASSEGSPPNGVVNGVNHDQSSKMNGTLTNSHSDEQYLCHKCHLRKDQPPLEPEPQKMDLDPEPPALAREEPRSPSPKPPIAAPAPVLWGPLSNIPVQAPTHGTWPPSNAFNGTRSPSTPTAPFINHAAQPLPPPGYSRPAPTPPMPSQSPSYLMHGHPPHPSQPPPGQRHAQHHPNLPPPLAPAPSHHAGMPNGVPLHSPTHPPQHGLHPLASRPPEMQYAPGPRPSHPSHPPPPPAAHHPYGHHHSPVQMHMASPGMAHVHSPLPPPVHVAHPPMVNRSHNASASPSVRNLIDD